MLTKSNLLTKEVSQVLFFYQIFDILCSVGIEVKQYSSLNMDYFTLCMSEHHGFQNYCTSWQRPNVAILENFKTLYAYESTLKNENLRISRQ